MCKSKSCVQRDLNSFALESVWVLRLISSACYLAGKDGPTFVSAIGFVIFGDVKTRTRESRDFAIYGHIYAAS